VIRGAGVVPNGLKYLDEALHGQAASVGVPGAGMVARDYVGEAIFQKVPCPVTELGSDSVPGALAQGPETGPERDVAQS